MDYFLQVRRTVPSLKLRILQMEFHLALKEKINQLKNLIRARQIIKNREHPIRR